MDFKQLKAFLTVAETGNVTRAAEILHLVQPAVSRQIRLLEEDVGAALFERERHGMVLTEAGHALLGYARRALLELDRARSEISASTPFELSGLVTLGLLPSTVDVVSAQLVSAVAREYPGIRIRLAVGYAGTLLRWLELGEVDAALLYGAERSAEVQMTPVMEEPLWVIGPKEAGLRRSQPMELARLVGQPLVLPSAPHGIRTLVDHACAVAGITLNVTAETNALSVQRALVLGGHGLTILPPIAVADDLHARRLSGAPLAKPEISRTIALGLPKNRATGQHVRRTIELLSREMKRAVDSRTWLEGKWINKGTE